VTIYLGASFGLTGGEPARAEAVTGFEGMFGDSKKYGLYAEGTYGQNIQSAAGPDFGGSVGLVRDNSRFGAYANTDPLNPFGLKFTQRFEDPLTWLKRKR